MPDDTQHPPNLPPNDDAGQGQPDDNKPPTGHDNGDEGGVSPSMIFVEMMRQAAARSHPDTQPAHPPHTGDAADDDLPETMPERPFTPDDDGSYLFDDDLPDDASDRTHDAHSLPAFIAQRASDNEWSQQTANDDETHHESEDAPARDAQFSDTRHLDMLDDDAPTLYPDIDILSDALPGHDKSDQQKHAETPEQQATSTRPSQSRSSQQPSSPDAARQNPDYTRPFNDLDGDKPDADNANEVKKEAKSEDEKEGEKAGEARRQRLDAIRAGQIAPGVKSQRDTPTRRSKSQQNAADDIAPREPRPVDPADKAIHTRPRDFTPPVHPQRPAAQQQPAQKPPSQPQRVARPQSQKPVAKPRPGDEAPTQRIPRYPVPEFVDEAGNVLSEESAKRQHDEKLQAERVRRVKRRQERRRRRQVGIVGGFLRTVLITLMAAGLTSTIFTWFTSPDFIQPEVASSLLMIRSTSLPTSEPTSLPTPNWLRQIGIVSGHRGPENDPGAVCEDGLTEAEINFDIAQRVVRNLRTMGYRVDLLDEFDPRLQDYRAAALVSLHANSCTLFNGEAPSGYMVAKAAARPQGGQDNVLAECIAAYYERATQLERWFSLTIDMTDYHTFREIHINTPAAIVELGFMLGDRELLTTQQDMVAQGITNGILCYLEPQRMPMPTAMPPTATPTSTALPARP